MKIRTPQLQIAGVIFLTLIVLQIILRPLHYERCIYFIMSSVQRPSCRFIGIQTHIRLAIPRLSCRARRGHGKQAKLLVRGGGVSSAQRSRLCVEYKPQRLTPQIHFRDS